MESLEGTVRRMLAHYPGRDPSRARRWQHLKNDLDVTPMEIELVALEVEQLIGVTLPLEELVTVHTVGDLLTFFFHAAHRERRGRAGAAAPPKRTSRRGRGRAPPVAPR